MQQCEMFYQESDFLGQMHVPNFVQIGLMIVELERNPKTFDLPIAGSAHTFTHDTPTQCKMLQTHTLKPPPPLNPHIRTLNKRHKFTHEVTGCDEPTETVH